MLNCKLSGDNLKNTQSLALFSMCHFADIVLDLRSDFVLMDKEIITLSNQPFILPVQTHFYLCNLPIVSANCQCRYPGQHLDTVAALWLQKGRRNHLVCFVQSHD